MNKPNRDPIVPVILDIEASGFGCDSYPIEVGVIDENGQRYCSLIQPADDWIHWSRDAELTHGISRKKIEQRGRQRSQVIFELNQFLKGKTVFCDCWSHDYTWLRKLYFSELKEPSFKLSAIENILTTAQIEIWDAIKQEVIEKTSKNRHRASTDAFIIQKTWIRTREGF